MAVTMYGLKTCDTCKKAIKMLETVGIEVQYVDVRADGVPKTVLAEMYQQFGAALVNTRSTTWRGLDADQRACNPLDLLAEFPTLMKRPVIVQNGIMTIGWGKDVQNQYIG